MNPPAFTVWPRMLVVLMGLAFFLSVGWAWWQWPAVHRLQLAPPLRLWTGVKYRHTDFAAAAVPAVLWPAPPVPASPTDWLFEEFTPPLIYFDQVARTFAVTAPQLSVMDPGPFGLELQEIRLEPYRVQLAGYFGGPGGYVVALTTPGRSGPTLLRVGERQTELGLRLVDFSIRKVPARAGAPAALVAQAVLQDEQTGRTEELESGSCKYTGRALAVLRRTGPDRTTHELHEGESVAEAGSLYRLEHISLHPAEAVVSRLIAGRTAPLVRVLQPVGRTGEARIASQAAPSPAEPTDTLATNSP